MVGDEHGLARWKREGLDWQKAHPETDLRRYNKARYFGNQVEADPHLAGGRVESSYAHNTALHKSSRVRNAVVAENNHLAYAIDLDSIHRAMNHPDQTARGRRELQVEKTGLERRAKKELTKKLIAQGTIADPKKEERKVRQREKLTGKKAGRSVGE